MVLVVTTLFCLICYLNLCSPLECLIMKIFEYKWIFKYVENDNINNIMLRECPVTIY